MPKTHHGWYSQKYVGSGHNHSQQTNIAGLVRLVTCYGDSATEPPSTWGDEVYAGEFLEAGIEVCDWRHVKGHAAADYRLWRTR